MLATVAVLASYLDSNLTGMISALEAVQKFFLFYFYEATAEALENGQQIGNTLALLAVALISSYLIGEEPVHLNSMYWRDEDVTQLTCIPTSCTQFRWHSLRKDCLLSGQMRWP